ncbi:D-lactate dehydrogenase VanH [Paenibacillus thiaminolyticus]|uniref:D-lactate dehydrogenase VanH n=1 Tax=Paenibacillus thiaminolyticus TaxID=49283 RepID=UPI002542FED3|nr:D-lactate dehydrogenase VanH [Paenibacillus thiaminolyticus]WII35275.1 D-lactate dehydrogenase VanH [Paenibacillus thiaminolyticus]
MNNIGITVYGCEHDEADVFRRLSPRFGVIPAITSSAVSETNAMLSPGNQCISVGHKSKVSKPTIAALKNAGVKYISTRSVGFNHIDMKAAKDMGIAVGNVAYSPGSVADYTLMLMLMAVRNTKSIMSSAEKYDFRLDAARGKELRDMTVGVLGTGHIGKAVIERLRGFGCHVLAHGRNKEAKADYVSFDELLQKSDILTIHVPLDTDTYHLIGRKQIDTMKQGAFLINTARGGIVDTDMLIKALENGKLGGAALDVLEGEEELFYFDCTQKPIDNQFLFKLQKMPNVIITPHTAYYTERALHDIVEKTILNCLNFERGQLYG